MSLFGNTENTQNNSQTESFVGIDIGTYAIKALQIRKAADQIHLETYGELEMAAYDYLPLGSISNLGEQKIIQALRDLFTAAKITATNVIFGIPISSCFMSSLNLPKVSDQELQSLVPMEARKYLPIPVSEVQINYWRAEIDNNINNAEDIIIVAAVKNDTLDMYNRYAAALGLKNVSLEIESLAGARIVGKDFDKNQALLFVDIGGRVSSATFIHQGLVKSTNIIQHGSYGNTAQISKVLGIGIDIAEKTKRLFGYLGDDSSPHLAEVMGLASYPLFDEISHLSLKYERQYNVNIDKIILSGGGSLATGVKEFASEFLKKEIILADPLQDLILPENFKTVATMIDQKYTVAAGLAMKNIL